MAHELRKHFNDRTLQPLVLLANTWPGPDFLFRVCGHRFSVAGCECCVPVALPDEFFQDEVALLATDLFRLFEEIPLVRPFAARRTVFSTVF